jgi:hypothetical protein
MRQAPASLFNRLVNPNIIIRIEGENVSGKSAAGALTGGFPAGEGTGGTDVRIELENFFRDAGVSPVLYASSLGETPKSQINSRAHRESHIFPFNSRRALASTSRRRRAVPTPAAATTSR